MTGLFEFSADDHGMGLISGIEICKNRGGRLYPSFGSRGKAPAERVLGRTKLPLS